jgi:hypothetical protein
LGEVLQVFRGDKGKGNAAMSEHPSSKEQLNLNKVEPLVVEFDEERMTPPSVNYLRAHVQGQIVFIGHYWMYETEARALRDWLTKVLP